MATLPMQFAAAMRAAAAAQASYLKTRGYVVIPNVLTETERTAFSESINQALINAPERSEASGEDKSLPLVLGGFGAYGTPTSFHASPIRSLRSAVYMRLIPLLNELAGEDSNLELLIDRFCQRPKDTKLSKESCHRDTSPKGAGAYPTLGGWISLKGASSFSCVPETHDITGAIQQDGFTLLPKEEQAEFGKKCEEIPVPAGAAILFYENIIHRVRGNPTPEDHERLFIGARFTPRLEDIPPINFSSAEKYEEAMKSQAPIPLKSGQRPPMYAAMHMVNWQDRLEKFSRRFADAHCVEHIPKAGANKGKKMRMVRRFLRPLRASAPGKMHRDYTQDELDLHKPGRAFRVCVGGMRVELNLDNLYA